MGDQLTLGSMLVLDGLTKAYADQSSQPALDRVTLSVDAGEFVVVMGPSGSGKSTLLNLIAGLDRPTQGTVTVNDIRLARLSEGALAQYRRNTVGFIFQFFNLVENLTVMDNVRLPAWLAGTRSRAVDDRARELLSQLGISGKERTYPARLSGGERQRVAIARALINRPALLLADEPTGALDSRNGDEVLGLVAELNRRGQTIILVTHDPNVAARHASRVIRLRDGRVLNDSGATRFASKTDDEAWQRGPGENPEVAE